jgi:hypothetical protein
VSLPGFTAPSPWKNSSFSTVPSLSLATAVMGVSACRANDAPYSGDVMLTPGG